MFKKLMTMFLNREKYPEFLPRTDYPGFLTNPPMAYRDRIRERLEREDMYRRRDVLNIPEFYVGKNCLFSHFTCNF